MHDRKPTISVVMCVYNGAQFLEEAIRCILDQTYTDFEFIIVDDGSTDGSVDILDQFQKSDTRIRVVRNADNSGLGVSLQKGIALARGEYIARMDADDISLPDRLEKQLRFLDQNPKILVVGGQCDEINEKSEITSSIQIPTDPELMRWNMLLGNGYIFIHGSILARKLFFDEVGNYGNFPTAQDFELWSRLSDHNPLPFANLDSTIYHYRQHEQTTTRSQNDLQENIAIEVRLEKIQEFLGKTVPKEVVLAYRYPTYAYSNIDECVRIWLEIYRKFLMEFRVKAIARREIQNELFNRLNKYTYIPPQNKNTEFRVSLWKVLRQTPFILGEQILFSKIGWALRRL